MKKILFLACAVVAMVSCKKENGNPINPEEGEIVFSTQTLTKGTVYDYSAQSNNFGKGDQIGMFLVNNNADGDVAFPYTFDEATKQERVNVGYTYGLPYWATIEVATKKMKYPTLAQPQADPAEAAAKLFAYFPYAKTGEAVAAGRCVKVVDAVGVPTVTYALPTDQTKNEVLKYADLMWAGALGEGATKTGFKLSSKPIEVVFNHLLTKVIFDVKVGTSNPKHTALAPAGSRFLRAIKIQGKNIETTDHELQVVTGKLVRKGGETDNTNQVIAPVWVKYFAAAAVAGADPIANPAVIVPELDVPAYNATIAYSANVVVNDMLLIPFKADQLDRDNEIVIYLDTDDTNVYADETALEVAVKAGTVEKYTTYIPKPGTDGVDKWKFTKNNANKLNIKIDINSKNIEVTTKITPWNEVDHGDIPAE